MQVRSEEGQVLGHEITAHGRRTNEDKVKAVRDWPAPRNRRQLMRFLGLANYLRKFVRNFSKICLPLHKLLRKRVPFFWSSRAQTAFDSLKQAITTTPVLQHVQPKDPFWIETDASDYAVGCVLLQKNKKGHLKPCAFYSRSLRDAEKNYITYEKELLAIKVAFEEWRHYLEGAPHRIMVISDHQGLESLGEAKVTTQRHARWSIFFRRFKFVIKYRPGSKNLRADALSRRPDYMPDRSQEKLKQDNILGKSVVQVSATVSNRTFMENVKKALAKEPSISQLLVSENTFRKAMG